jgi:hypothetical protein
MMNTFTIYYSSNSNFSAKEDSDKDMSQFNQVTNKKLTLSQHRSVSESHMSHTSGTLM